MTKEITTTEEKVEAPKAATKRVTSTVTIDFPALGWGIHAGEERELPVDAQAQKEILSNHYISIIK